MNTPRWLPTIFGLATTIAASGCICGANREQRAITISSGVDSLTVLREGGTLRISNVLRASVPPNSPSQFDFAFNTLEGATSGEGIALSLSGNDPVTDELVTLALAVPVSLRRGEEYSVGGTFTFEAGGSDPRLFGPYDLRQSNQAEVGFIIAKYSFPPPSYTTSFQAVTTTGTIRVTQRTEGSVELTVNLSLVDAAGKTVKVTGRLQASTEEFTLSCIS
jgi:hypothetical protein